jgi:hypothetical protein
MKIRHTTSLTALALANRNRTLATLGVANDRGFLNLVFIFSGDSAYVVS